MNWRYPWLSTKLHLSYISHKYEIYGWSIHEQRRRVRLSASIAQRLGLIWWRGFASANGSLSSMRKRGGGEITDKPNIMAMYMKSSYDLLSQHCYYPRDWSPAGFWSPFFISLRRWWTSDEPLTRELRGRQLLIWQLGHRFKLTSTITRNSRPWHHQCIK